MPFPQCALYQFPLVSCWKFKDAMQMPLTLLRRRCILMPLPRHLASRLFLEPEGYEEKSNDNMGISSWALQKTRFTYTKTCFFRGMPAFLKNS